MKKIALVTGASSGIGRATALAFAQKGIALILCGRREDRLLELQKEIDVESVILLFDVRDRDSVNAAIASLDDQWKKIDILVNNAGNAHGLSSFDKGEVDDWDNMIDGNVKGLLYVSRQVVPEMIANGGGHIVNLSSVAGKQTYENGAVYCASKKSVEAISEGMRLDLTKHGIKVTNIAPGAVETEFSEVRFKGDKDRAKQVYAGFDPLHAADIADAITYCIMAPDHVTIADMTIYAKAQAAPTVIYRK
ncbi:SDR family NAD(P)-dependent oxidoreductase [Emticicia sp. CRIBPO]|uniref:SDR family NAD(P)-dependent oxidoreductase n=1 Tax=Emticicia sp. CRIBPO TaxID=2683258 RepID=UPI001412F72B|nr:SDR family NAD(P)-dependent oxidoreductase [Emticicia sp. CRIBPO]NBA88262.1 SDR family NAD(P)-dependent oxidoreductase [Emticicia sp. CRIBPO]